MYNPILHQKLIEDYNLFNKKISGKKGASLLTKGYKYAANIYRENFCDGKSRPLMEGEIHPLCANFEGPGTKIWLDEVKNYPPYDNVDACAKQHDLAYYNSDHSEMKEQLRREADRVFLKCIEPYKNEEPYYSLGNLVIQGKISAEDIVPDLVKYLAPGFFGQDKKGASKYGTQMTYKTVCQYLKKLEDNGFKLQTDLLKDHKKGSLILVGSTGRLRPFPEDLDFLAVDIPLDKLLKFYQDNYKVTKILQQGKEQLFFLISENGKPREINFWHTTKQHLPYAFFTYAYPKKITIALRKVAQMKGYKLNQKGLYKNDKLIKVKNYMDIFDLLGIPKRTPVEQTIREVKYKHSSNTEEALEKIRKNGEVKQWIDKYMC